ncbi:hypothetical protein [Phytopseudomonas daroniae]|uniref:hypothetical protein n=1 Tax=Phytopseudomonas daroniae TaxID=2487519 RepID=UPI0010383693|nr:hypothetical protein [Pseudomonas daroniae]TBU75203.1 hypothetical protein DNK10_11140 [Pseudomonas daroniae]
MALTTDRNTPRRDGVQYNDPVAGATRIYAGSIVCLNAAGNAVPGSSSAALKVRGRAEEHVDNRDGTAGAKRIESRRGVFAFANSSGADEITRADIGEPAYIVDDQTVAKTSDTDSRSVAGVIQDLDDAGVWIEI